MLGFKTEVEEEQKPEPQSDRVGKRPPRGLRSERSLIPVIDGPLKGTMVEKRKMNNRFTSRCGTQYRGMFFWDEAGRRHHYWTMK
jgi:hypothetical protein